MILIVNCGSTKTRFIEQAVDYCCDFQTIGMHDLNQINLGDFKGVIISGAPILLTEIDPLPYQELFAWIKTYENPLLGICFGHQMLGLSFGGFASRQKEDRDWQTIETLIDSPLFNRLPHEFDMMQDHCESVSIPPNFEHLAVSDACVNEAMQHKEKLLFGVQFHPEVSGNLGSVLIENFVNICLDQTKG